MGLNVKRVFFILMLYLFSCATHGGVYQWTDENGHVHFGNVPPQLQDEYSLGDKIKAAQQKQEQPVDKSVKSENLVQEKILDKPEELSKIIISAPIRKVSREELEALIIKLRHSAGLNFQKSVAEGVGASQTEIPAVVEVNSVGSVEKPETTDAGKTVSNIDSTMLELENSENVKIAQPVLGKEPETEIEKILEAKITLATTTAVEESLVVLSLVAESDKDANLFGEEDYSDEDNEIVLETNSNSDKCGLFMGFVEQYQLKQDEGCPGSHCNVYKRQLEKFREKEEQYCG